MNQHEWKEAARSDFPVGDFHFSSSRQAGMSLNFGLTPACAQSVAIPSGRRAGKSMMMNIDYSELEIRILSEMMGKVWACKKCGLRVRSDSPPPGRSVGSFTYVVGRHALIPLFDPPEFQDCYDFVVQEVLLS